MASTKKTFERTSSKYGLVKVTIEVDHNPEAPEDYNFYSFVSGSLYDIRENEYLNEIEKNDLAAGALAPIQDFPVLGTETILPHLPLSGKKKHAGKVLLQSKQIRTLLH